MKKIIGFAFIIWMGFTTWYLDEALMLSKKNLGFISDFSAAVWLGCALLFMAVTFFNENYFFDLQKKQAKKKLRAS